MMSEAPAATKRILLVDDDYEIIESMRMLLEAKGYAVMVARDGNQGLAMAEREEGLRLEPSALAGVPGIAQVSPLLPPELAARATHLAWATGGSMVPAAEMDAYLARGRALLAR